MHNQPYFFRQNEWFLFDIFVHFTSFYFLESMHLPNIHHLIQYYQITFVSFQELFWKHLVFFLYISSNGWFYAQIVEYANFSYVFAKHSETKAKNTGFQPITLFIFTNRPKKQMKCALSSALQPVFPTRWNSSSGSCGFAAGMV